MSDELNRPWVRNYEDGVRPSLDYRRVPLPQFLREAAASDPGHTAIIYSRRKISYGELDRAVRGLGRGLASLGVKKGDRVGLLLPNSPPYVIGYYAAMSAGAIVVSLNPLAVERELLFLIRRAGCETVLVADSLLPKIAAVSAECGLRHIIVSRLRDWAGWPKPSPRKKPFPGKGPGQREVSFETLIHRYGRKEPPRVAVRPEDEALLQFTGPITEKIKGVVLTHANLGANTQQIASWVVRARRGKEVFLSVLPLFHAYGMAVAMNLPIYLASTMILLPRFEVRETLRAIRRHRPTFLAGVPPMFVALSQAGEAERDSLSCLKVCCSGGAPLSPEVLEDFEKLIGIRINEGYGLAEASPATHCNPIFGKRKVGSVGLPYPDTLAKIVDLDTGENSLPPGEAGELCIQGPQVMQGYWKMPRETAETLRRGWLYTGDIARMDEDGYFYILDVRKDMIIAGGFNIYPKDIDQVLAEHPKVAEAVAIGIPDRTRGEAIKALVVLKQGESATGEEIIDFCRKNLAQYKIPSVVEFRDRLPKSASGKILRRTLRQEEIDKGSRAPGVPR